jgi:hypothetical protein
MAGSKRAMETPAWLLTADRYMAEIADAERAEALAAAAEHKTGQVGGHSRSYRFCQHSRQQAQPMLVLRCGHRQADD